MCTCLFGRKPGSVFSHFTVELPPALYYLYSTKLLEVIIGNELRVRAVGALFGGNGENVVEDSVATFDEVGAFFANGGNWELEVTFLECYPFLIF
jgi:hypothetical protein